MSTYEAPQITRRQELSGALGRIYSVENGLSDSTVKHMVTPVRAETYQAPKIIEQRKLDAQLVPISQLDAGR